MCPSILLVDIDSSDRESWKAFLQNQNYEVFTAEDGDSALSQCLFLQPDLVLLYDSLPQIDGFELCRRLKDDPLNHLIPVVLIKPSLEPTDISRGRLAGAADFWGTCASLGEGLSRVQSLLRLKSYIDEQAKSVVLSLARSIEAKHSLTEGHSERMTEYAVQFGERLGMPEKELQDLRIACLLHDIGKLAVPDGILLKPGPLNEEEMEIVRQHPITGEEICAPLKSLRHILPIIRNHHELLDGSGYPDGLCGGEIPLKARILQIADVFDALTTDRPYRMALSLEDALEILGTEAMRGWRDTGLVREFASICRSYENYPGIGRSMLASYYGVPHWPRNSTFT
ncbi:MAG TPA: HD domain-containing phosphohydrolase [Terriglobales bacterium]|nr:HD domain-containing phosphohydrolase [Terriglobales bacterium]